MLLALIPTKMYIVQSDPDEESERETGTRLGEVFVNSPHKARARARECIFSHRQRYLKINETLRHITVFQLDRAHPVFKFGFSRGRRNEGIRSIDAYQMEYLGI